MSNKSIRRSSRAIYTGLHQTLRRSPRLLSSERIGNVSSLQSIEAKDSAETHLGNLSNMSVESGIKSRLRGGSHQTSLMRSIRLPPPENLKPAQKSTVCCKSVEKRSGSPSIVSNLKEEVSSKKFMEAICGKGQLKQSRSKSGVVLEGKRSSPRRSLRSAFRTERKDFETPQGFYDGNPRRQSMMLLGVAPVSAENVTLSIENANKPGDMVERKKHIEVKCKPMSSQIRRSSPRLMATSNAVMKTGVSLEMTDKGDEVAEKFNAVRGDLVVKSRVEDGFVITKTDDLYKGKRRKMEEDNEVENRIENIENEECCSTAAWTNEQEKALQKAYLISKPSPHFWKKVSRMVPGKSAQECFDKVHASVVTPLPLLPQSRTRKKSQSPIANLNLSANIFPHVSEIEVGRLKRCRTKKLAAQKTVRHLLRKQCLVDQTKGDHFSLFESFPVKIAVNVLNTTTKFPCLSQQPGEKLSVNSKVFSRLKPLTSPDGSSPQVLKRIMNRALHDRYIDQLHHREARRVTLAKKTKFEDLSKRKFSKPEHNALKAARTALISDAKSFINHFQHTSANPIDELETDYIDDADEDIDVSDLDE